MKRNGIISRIVSAFTALVLVACVVPGMLSASAEDGDSGVVRRLTPIMGWSSWNYYSTNVSEAVIVRQMDALASTGLKDLGYTFVNIDDGWQNGRENGKVVEKARFWPNGMKYVADLAHNKGFSIGIYSDAGDTTCGWYDDAYTTDKHVGLYGHEESDLNTYLDEWGYDFIKVDWCGGSSLKLDTEEAYTNIGNIIRDIEKRAGKDKIYNVCCWHFPGEWVCDAADSWRIRGDIYSAFESILAQIDNAKDITQYTGPGHVNDLDMLEVGNGMSYDEDKSHFSMWCMLSAPLLIGTDVGSISDETLSILSNEELIALDQDPACLSAYLASENTEKGYEIWVKPVGGEDSGTRAVALLNRSESAVTVDIDFASIGLYGVEAVRDLWQHTDLPATGGVYTVTVPAHGICVLKASGVTAASTDTVIVPYFGTADNGIDISAVGDKGFALFANGETDRTGSSFTYTCGTQKTGSAFEFTWSNGKLNPSGSISEGVSGDSFALSIPVHTRPSLMTVYFSCSGNAVFTSECNGTVRTSTLACKENVLYEYNLYTACDAVTNIAVSPSGSPVTLYGAAYSSGAPASGVFYGNGAADVTSLGAADWQIFGDNASRMDGGRGISSCETDSATGSTVLTLLSSKLTRTAYLSFESSAETTVSAYYKGRKFASGTYAPGKNSVCFDYVTPMDNEITVVLSAGASISSVAVTRQKSDTGLSGAVACINTNGEGAGSLPYTVSSGNAIYQFSGVAALTAYDFTFTGTGSVNVSSSDGHYAGLTLKDGTPGRIRVYHSSSDALTVTVGTGSEAKLTDVTVTGHPVFLGTPKVGLSGGKLSVESTVAYVEGAVLHTAVFSEDGRMLYHFENNAAEGTNTCTFDVSAASVCTVRQFLWTKDGAPLTESVAASYTPDGYSAKVESAMLGALSARALVKKGAVLLDVRTADEFAAGTIEGSVNLPHTQITKASAEALIPETDKPVIVFCSSSKRSIQAFAALTALGYTNVRILGSMNNWYTDYSSKFSPDFQELLTAGDSIEFEHADLPYDKYSVTVVYHDTEYPIETFRLPDSHKQYEYITLKVICEGECMITFSHNYFCYREADIDVFASSLTFTDAFSGWGSVRADKSVEGNPITVTGKVYGKGIGAHADSVVSFKIPENASCFVALAGYDDEVSVTASGCKTVFSIYIDDKLVATSDVLLYGDSHLFIVNIPEGASKMSLVTEKSYDNNYNDHSDWAIAGFID